MHDSKECHVVSLVVHVRADGADAAFAAIGAVDGADIHVSDHAGRCVVLLESEDESRILTAIQELEHIAGVLSVALVYHEVDTA